MYPPIHEKTVFPDNFTRLEKLWDNYTQFHKQSTFTTLDKLLEEHESYQKDFTEELRKEYESRGYDKFLIQLSWSDLPYRYATKDLIEKSEPVRPNRYVEKFMDQFRKIDTFEKCNRL